MADIDVHYDPISVVGGPVTVDIQGLDNTSNKITLETPQPLKLETKSELAVTQSIKTESKFELSTPQPIKADSKTELDVKPLAIDQCLRISLAPLPPTCIRVPTQQQIGFTIFGVEVIGLRFSGEAQFLICDPGKDPHVVWGEVTPQAPQQKPAFDEARSLPSEAEKQPGDGFRIRLGG
jgi:hypothetical protein